MYNCKMATGHYWGVMRFDGKYCDSLKVVEAYGYKEPPKRKPELQEDFILVKKTRLVELDQKEAILDQMIKQFKEKGLKGGREYRLVQEGREMKENQMMGREMMGREVKGRGRGYSCRIY